jgi:hypothetical protein
MIPDVLRDPCVVSTDADDSCCGLMGDGGAAYLRGGWEDRKLHVLGGIDRSLMW